MAVWVPLRWALLAAWPSCSPCVVAPRRISVAPSRIGVQGLPCRVVSQFESGPAAGQRARNAAASLLLLDDFDLHAVGSLEEADAATVDPGRQPGVGREIRGRQGQFLEDADAVGPEPG